MSPGHTSTLKVREHVFDDTAITPGGMFTQEQEAKSKAAAKSINPAAAPKMTDTRTAIVTGGARGIGAAIAQCLATDGRRVGVIDLH